MDLPEFLQRERQFSDSSTATSGSTTGTSGSHSTLLPKRNYGKGFFLSLGPKAGIHYRILLDSTRTVSDYQLFRRFSASLRCQRSRFFSSLFRSGKMPSGDCHSAVTRVLLRGKPQTLLKYHFFLTSRCWGPHYYRAAQIPILSELLLR